MPPVVSNMLGKVSNTARGFTLAQRTLAVIGMAILVLGIVALTAWLTKPNYSPLFSGVAASDANAIVTQLKTDNVPYQLSNGGSTILVPDNKVYDERIKAAAAGLPSATTGGYSLLDNMGVTSSEFEQSVTYKRAMEGELAKTIMAMDGVTMASVKLAIPDKTVFASTTDLPTASVFVETTPGTVLTENQVDAVVHLTSSAVDGLTPANVTVVDAQGNVLSAGGSGAASGAGKQTSAYESRVSDSVQAMLDKVLGPGNSTVSLNATLDNSTSQVVKESFAQPRNAPALSESSQTDAATGGTGNNAGVLGPDNIAVPSTANGAGNSKSSKVTKNNAIDKTTQDTSIPAGTLQRQSIAVAINSSTVKGITAAQLTSMISTAAGVNAARGDTVTVTMVPFSTAQAQAAQTALAQANAQAQADATAHTWRVILISAVAVLLLILALLIYARKNRRQVREVVDLGEKSGPVVNVDPLQLTGGPATAALPAIPEPVLLPAVETSDMDAKRASIDALASTDPQKTAALLRSLMDDRSQV